ncbi:MAG: cell division protein FtsA [Verrucomicrobia bacterium]|nr:MAG: cell division protein FtsA [Verrucomicrobiota bacterium]
MNLPPVVALEIGTTKVRALVGELTEEGQLVISGLGECPSRGVRKGEIIDFDNALSCVREALQQAEENGHLTINQVHLLVSGGHIRSLVNRGAVPVLNDEGEITAEEIERVEEMARAVSLPTDHEILHTIRQHFYVNDGQAVVKPEGMEGARLALDMLILHGLRNPMRNIVKVVRSAQVDVQDVAFSGLCAALAVLTPAEKNNGALMIDLGGGTTDYVAYAEERLADAGAFAVGGDHLSNDLAFGLRIPLAEAERVKLEYGAALSDLSLRNQTVSVNPGTGQPPRMVRLADVHTIMHVRMEETLVLIREQLRQNKLISKLGSGVVLTGGGARLKKVDQLAEKIFGLPCRLGRPRDVNGLTLVMEQPECAAVVGMLRYAARTFRPTSGIFDRLRKIVGI